MMQIETDTLPFTNRFNYLVEEISVEEFLKALTKLQVDEDEDKQNRNEQLRDRVILCY